MSLVIIAELWLIFLMRFLLWPEPGRAGHHHPPSLLNHPHSQDLHCLACGTSKHFLYCVISHIFHRQTVTNRPGRGRVTNWITFATTTTLQFFVNQLDMTHLQGKPGDWLEVHLLHVGYAGEQWHWVSSFGWRYQHIPAYCDRSFSDSSNIRPHPGASLVHHQEEEDGRHQDVKLW